MERSRGVGGRHPSSGQGSISAPVLGFLESRLARTDSCEGKWLIVRRMGPAKERKLRCARARQGKGDSGWDPEGENKGRERVSAGAVSPGGSPEAEEVPGVWVSRSCRGCGAGCPSGPECASVGHLVAVLGGGEPALGIHLSGPGTWEKNAGASLCAPGTPLCRPGLHPPARPPGRVRVAADTQREGRLGRLGSRGSPMQCGSPGGGALVPWRQRGPSSLWKPLWCVCSLALTQESSMADP